jgi:hypothetical protein
MFKDVCKKAKNKVSVMARNARGGLTSAVVGGAAAATTALSPLNANATGLTAPTIDLTDFYAAAAVLLTALAALWIANKVIGFFRTK